MMSALGKRTSERDAAVAERDRLRGELAALSAGQEPPSDGPEPLPDAAQLRAATDEPLEAPGGSEQADTAPSAEAAAPEYELPAGTVITTPDGSQYLIREGRAGTIAPTSPKRSMPTAPSTELEALRQRFAAELPAYVAEVQDRALLRGGR